MHGEKKAYELTYTEPQNGRTTTIYFASKASAKRVLRDILKQGGAGTIQETRVPKSTPILRGLGD